MFSELARFLGLKTSQKTKPVIEEKKSNEPEKSINEEPVEDHMPIADESAPEVSAEPKKNIRKKIITNKSKNGVPVLSKNFDFSNVFKEELHGKDDNNDHKEYNKTEKQKPDEISEKFIIDKYSDPASNKAKQIIPIKTDRKGIPQLSSVHDLETLIATGIEGIERTEIPQAYKKQSFEKSVRKTPIDKNKIPILSETIDLTKEFGSDSEKGFHELLSMNLEGKSRNELLREKKEKAEKPKPIPVEQRIKRYPGPQEDLDLHGFTAIEADRKTDIFIRSARRRGLFTVRIIVGKGIHSQGRAVLPDVVEDRLAALKNEKEILTFRWEKRLKTQSGSVIAYLNQYD